MKVDLTHAFQSESFLPEALRNDVTINRHSGSGFGHLFLELSIQRQLNCVLIAPRILLSV